MNIKDYVPELSAETWAGLSAYVATASATFTFIQALIAFFGLWFVGRQIRDARRASDVQNLFAFYKSITDAEHALARASDGEDKDQAFYELANLLEIHAMALRGGIYTGVTKEAVELKLIDACAFIQLYDFWWSRLNSGRSTEAAFKDLFRFIKKRRRKIERVKKLLQSETSSTEAVVHISPEQITTENQINEGQSAAPPEVKTEVAIQGQP